MGLPRDSVQHETFRESACAPVLVPRDYLIAPVFAACKQSGAREIVVNQRKYQIGGFHPLRPELRPPALDVRHARALFALLSFRNQDRDPANPRLIRFSFNELCRKYANSNGGKYARSIMGIVADLMDSYIRVTDIETNNTHEYRLIEHVDIEKRPPRRKDARIANSRQLEIFFNGCILSRELEAILDRITELQHVRLNVLTKIKSPLAQAVYLYIPSRAYHHDESRPFEITVSRLLEQVSFPVPHQKSRRKQLLTQNRNSILHQLNELPTLTGKFRVNLAETADGKDWKFQAWVEPNAKKYVRDPANSKLMKAFLDGGHSQEDLDRRLSAVKALTDYETELLRVAEVELDGNRRFFEMAKALIGEGQFQTLLAEAKGDLLEGRRAKKSPTAKLIWRIMNFFEARENTSVLTDGKMLRDLLNEKRLPSGEAGSESKLWRS